MIPIPPAIIHIADLIGPPHAAIALFTRGERFDPHPGEEGHIAAYRINPHHVPHGMTVVVYLRTLVQNTIYVGHCAGTEDAGLDENHHHRYRINVPDFHAVGVTNNSWRQCAQTQRRDFRYYH